MCRPDSSHNWSRFVISTGEIAQLEGDFLLDPETPFGASANPGVVDFDSLADQPCVILLGDSGLGKSDVFRRAYESTADRTGGIAVFCDVGSYSNDVLIEQFLSSSAFGDWISSDRVLSLFVDGLDEGIMRGNGWVGIIERKLADWSRRAEEGRFPAVAKRLQIRISCRPGLWPDSLLRRLSSFFPAGSATAPSPVSVWDLLPLRWRDVALASTDHGMDPDVFRNEIRRVGAESFAARPLTLKLLIKSMLQDGHLPGTQVQMFRRGCLHLVEEHSEVIRESGRRPTVTAERRLQVAARIAAMSIFCGKPWIERAAGPVAIPDSAVLNSSEIRGSAGREDVSEAELHETLGSALFSYRDPHTFRWTHQAFAAFLAADWCDRSDFSLKDLKDLIVVNGVGNSGVPQQVMWTARWLCEMRPQLQSVLAATSPSLLFALDEAAIDSPQKPKLVRQILRRSMSHEQSILLIRQGARLKYPTIAQDLKPYLQDKRRDNSQRHRAIDLAIACDAVELADDLARIANDQQEPYIIRRTAVFAVSRIGTDAARRAILPLAATTEDDDTQDLKGWALDANWPAHLSVLEVLRLIERRRRSDYHGGYVTFLHRFASELGRSLGDTELGQALQWCSTQRHVDELSVINGVVEAIMARAFLNVREPEICALLAREIISRLLMHVAGVPKGVGWRNSGTWEAAVEADPASRLLLLQCGIRLIDHENRYALLEFARTVQMRNTDGRSLLYLALRDPQMFSEPVGDLLAWIRDLDLIYEGLSAGCLPEQLRQLLYWDFSSEVVAFEREHYVSQEQNVSQEQRQRRVDERRRQMLISLETALGESEAGTSRRWVDIWNILWELSPRNWEGNPRVDESHAWVELDAPQRARCLAAAARYALCPGPIEFNFLAEHSYPIWAPAFYSALVLTWRNEPAALGAGADREWSL